MIPESRLSCTQNVHQEFRLCFLRTHEELVTHLFIAVTDTSLAVAREIPRPRLAVPLSSGTSLRLPQRTNPGAVQDLCLLRAHEESTLTGSVPQLDFPFGKSQSGFDSLLPFR
jgi:hypothetical protein